MIIMYLEEKNGQFLPREAQCKHKLAIGYAKVSIYEGTDGVSQAW
jgi:hypothetical protein